MKNYCLFFILFYSFCFSEQFFYEDFSENNFPPAGWETSGSPTDSNRWEVDNSSNSYNTTPPAIAYHWSPSTPGNYEPYSHEMLSPFIDVSGNTSVLVFFDIALDFWGASSFTNGMTISYNGGNGWVDILNYEIGPGAGFVEINRRTESFIAEIISGSDLQIKFTAYGTNSYYIDDWFIDNVEIVSAPKLNIVSITSSNENSEKGIIGDEISIDISSNTDLISNPIVQMNGNICDVSYGGDNRWIAIYIVQSIDPDGPIEFAIDFTDVNNVDGVTVRQSTDNTNVIVDNSDPPNFIVGDASSLGGNEYSNIWNETNLNISLEVNVPQDSAVSSYSYIDGNSLLFDGNNDEASITSISQYQFTNEMTIEAWIKPLSAPENYIGFLNRATDSGPLEAGFGFVFSSTGWHFFLKTDFPNSIDYTTMPVASAPVNQWTHLAAIYTGSKVVLFRNGIALDSSVVYGDVEWSGAPNEIILGSFTKDGTTKYFDGHIDEVRIWDIVRTRQEIKVYRKVELNGTETGLVGYWKIDQGSGGSINDFSVNSNNGVINGANWIQEDSPLQFKTPIYDTGVIIGSMFQLLGRIGSNSFEEFGVRDTITQLDFDNGIKYVDALKTGFENINDFAHGQTVQIRAYLYDDAGNFSIGDISDSDILIDIIANAPNTASIYSNNQFQNLAKTGDVITFSMEFNEDVNNPLVLIDGNNSDNVQDLGGEEFEASYTLIGSELNGILASFISVTDIYGNQNEYSGTTDGSGVRFDGIIPILDQVNVVSNNSWNQSWAKIGDTIEFFIDASEDLLNISILVENDNASISILDLDQYNFDYIFSNVNSDGLVEFEITFSDSAGNSGDMVTNTTNSSFIIFDKTAPSNFSVGDVITTGGNPVSAAWNSTNTGLNIIVPIDNDESLDSGRVQVQAKISDNNLEDLGDYFFITSNEVNNSKIISIVDIDVESIEGFTENDTIIFNTVIFDIPGNMTLGNESLTKLIINESLPVIINSNIESDFSDSSLASVGNIITLTFETDTEIESPSVLISDQNANVSNLEANDWIASYTMQGTDPDGQISFKIDFNDIHGNPNSISNNTSDGTAVTFDNSKPSLSVVNIKSTNQDTTLARVGDTIIIMFKGNELLVNQLATIASGNADINYNISDGITTYYAKYIMQEVDDEGEVNFEIIVTDDVGIDSNPVNESTNNSNVIFDRTLPVLNSLHIESNNTYDSSIGIAGDEIFLTFSSNEILIMDSIFVEISEQVVSITESGDIYTASYVLNGTEPSGNISYTLNYQDLAGNQGAQLDSTQDSSFVKHDLIPPEIIKCFISSDNSDSSWAKVGDTVFVTFISSEPLNNIDIRIVNISSDFIQINPNKYIGYLEMESEYNQGEIPFLLTYSDLGGMPGDDVSTTSNGSIVKFDSQIPSIYNISMKTDNIYGDTLAGIETSDTLRFSISEPYRRLNVVFDGENVTPNEDNLNYYLIKEFEEIDTSYWVPFSILMVDSAGNESEIFTNEILENQVWFDGQRPTLDSVLFFSNNINNSTVCAIGDSVYLKYSSSETLLSTNSSIANTSPDRIFQSNGFYNAVYRITGNESEGIIPFSVFNYEDIVGNLGPEVSSTTNNKTVIFDMTNPSNFLLGNIFSREGNEKIGYWNSTNRNLEITIPVDSDPTLEDGYFQIQVKFEEIYNNIGDSISINESSLGRDTIIIIEGDLFLNQEEFGDDKNALFRAQVWDKSGNTIISDVSNSSLHIDTTNVLINNIHIESNNIDSTLAKVGDSLFITFDVNEILDSVSVEVFENLSFYQNTGMSWQSFYEFQESDIEGFVSFNLYIEDIAGNVRPSISVTSDSSRVLFDKTKPTLDFVQFYSSNSLNQELAIVDDTLFLDILSSESLSNLEMYIGQTDGIYNIADTIINDNINNLSFSGSRILNGSEEDGFIQFKIGFSDFAGNIADTVEVTTNNSSVLFDRTAPADFFIENVFGSNGNEVEGYWNLTNNNLIFFIPIPDDNTLFDGGGIQIQTSFSDSNYIDLGDNYYIQEDDLNNNKTIIISEDQFENLLGFQEDINANFRAKMWDRAGNVTISFDNNNQLHIDVINPVISSVNIFSNNILDSSWAKVSDSVFINYTSSESLSVSNILVNNDLRASSNISDYNWEFFTQVTEVFLEGDLNFEIIYIDNAGNIGDTISNTNDGSKVEIDKIPPIVFSFYEGSDSLDLDFYNDSTSIHLYSIQTDSLSGIKDVFFTYTEDTTNINTLSWESTQGDTTNYSIDNLNLENNNIYYGGIYLCDYAGNVSDIIWGDGFIVDTQIPDTGKIEDGNWFLEMDYTPDSTELKYKWEGFSDNIGILNYEFSIGTNNNKTNVLDWFKTDSLEKITIRNLFLERDTCYFTYLRAYDSALNISEIIQTDGIYFDDSEPRVIKISPDKNDSLGFLSIQKKDTIKIKFNRNIFFYDLKIRSSVDSSFIFDQFYADSVLTISWDDTLASYDTLIVFLDSALAYNTLFVSDTLYFFSRLWGDLNYDYDINLKDIYVFNEQWPNIDIGPFYGNPPNVYPNLDGEMNLVDMSSFAKMWHWKYFNLSFDSINSARRNIYDLNLNAKGDKVYIKIPKNVFMAELLIGNSNLEISNYHLLKSLPSTFLYEVLDSVNHLKQFSFVDKNGLDSILTITISNKTKDYLEAQVQYTFLDEIGDTISYGNEKVFIEILPDNFKVYNNYPNPFNPITNIRFDLSDQSNVFIRIYDVLGREVFKNNIDKLKAGRHQFIWEGINNNGNKVSSGVYILQLVADKNSHMQKMLLLK